MARLVLLAIFGVVSGHNHEDGASSEASVQQALMSTSVQDYLSQISELEFRSNPTIAIPGEWLTDAKKTFVFLPVKVPQTLPLDEVKLLTDGRSLLVNVVERQAQNVEDAATKKFRLVLDAFKREANGDVMTMESKLKEWEEDEDDQKVRELIRQSLAEMLATDGRHKIVPKSLTIPLEGVELSELRSQIAATHAAKKAAARFAGPKISNPHGGTTTVKLRGTYLQQASKTKDEPFGGYGGFGGDGPNLITIPLNANLLQEVKNADYVEPLVDKDAFGARTADQSYIKESFSVTLPYPTSPSKVFAVLQSKGQVVVCMPYDKNGKSTVVPFSRVPIFDQDGRKLTGPGATAASELAPETKETRQEEGHPSKEHLAVVAKAQKVAAPPPPAADAVPQKLIVVGSAS